MLGIQYKKIESNSVGYKTDYEMHSLDFEEFLWARGYDHSIRTTLLNHMVTQTPFSPGILSTFFSLFMDFCILGGMPAVVRDYIANQTFKGSLNTQRQLLADYREDVRKYASGVDQTRIVNVPPPIEAGTSCFNENSTTDSEELWRLTLSPQA